MVTSVTDAVSSGLVVDGGLLIVLAQGTVIGTTVENGGTETLSNGGVAIDTVLTGAAFDRVSSGGRAIGATLSGGSQEVGPGGVAVDTVVDFAGVLTVDNEGAAINAVVSSGGIQTVELGGAATGTVVRDAGAQVVQGGTVGGTVVDNGGTQRIDLGTASATTVSSGGIELVAGGGSLVDVTLLSGAILGELDANIVGSSTTVTIAGPGSGATGLDITDLAFSNAVIPVSVNLLSGASVNLGATVILSGTGATAIGTTVQEAGTLQVVSGGTAYATFDGILGTDIVAAGGLAVSTVVQLGSETVLAGGATISTTVRVGGVETISSGGTASGLVISSGGSANVLAGATLTGAMLSVNARFEEVGLSLSGAGIAVTLALPTAGVVDADFGSDGLAVGAYALSGTDILAGASVTILAKGFAAADRVGSGGRQYVSHGGAATGTVVGGGGIEVVDNAGATSSTTVGDGGRQTVSAGGSADAGTVLGGGTEEVYFGANVTNLTLSAGAVLEDVGVALDAGTSMTAEALTVAIAHVAVNRGAGPADLLTVAVSTTVNSGATLNVGSGGIASDTVLSGGSLFVASGGAVLDALGFVGAGGMLALSGTTSVAATISGFAGGDTIDFVALGYVSGGTAVFDSATHALHVTDGAASFNLQLGAGDSYADGRFTLADDLAGGSEITIACFLAGTRIATPDGAVSVEALCAGDLVVTASGVARPVRWLGVQTVATCLADPVRLLPVRVRAGALGEGLPTRDLLVSPGHALLLDGVLVQAGALVNGTSIARATDMPERFRYYHVELDEHVLLLAEGAAAESYLPGIEDVAFDNAREREPPIGETRELGYARVKSFRQMPQALRHRLATIMKDGAFHEHPATAQRARTATAAA